MSATDTPAAVAKLDQDLAALAFVLGAALAVLVMAHRSADRVRREARTYRALAVDREDERDELRGKLDGALEDLHRVMRERDAARDAKPLVDEAALRAWAAEDNGRGELEDASAAGDADASRPAGEDEA